MNTKRMKTYNNKSLVERSASIHDKEGERISTYRRLIRLANRESYALLSLYKQYEEILARTVTSNDIASVVSDLYRKRYNLESGLRITVSNFFRYSEEIPDPWIMINGYSKMYRHFCAIRETFRFPLK